MNKLEKRHLNIQTATLVVTALATFALAIITFVYLIETSKIRELSEKMFLIDTSPKLYINGNIYSDTNYDKKSGFFETNIHIKITNGGKTEAKNVRVEYVVTAEQAKKEGVFGPINYVFPTQSVTINSDMFKFYIPKETMDKFKGKNGKITFPEDFGPKINLHVELKYEDLDGNEIVYPSYWKYLFAENRWTMPEQR